jgi:tetraacyldisaccharide 4'-kinase
MQKFIENHLYNRSIISYLLLPFGILNALIQVIRRWIFENFHFLRYKPAVKIISVGNIVSGGSGKTPVTIWIAKKMNKQGYNVAVSHRGYKGKFEKEVQIISDQYQIDKKAAQAGDEAFMLTQKLSGIPIVVGKNRRKAIKLLLSTFPELDYIILDDSFQHLKVEHDIDILVFNTVGGIGNGFVLPAGILREPINSVKKADYLVINGGGRIAVLDDFNIPQISARYEIEKFITPFGEEISAHQLRTSKIALLSAIGLPASFESTIKASELDFLYHLALPDHFNYDNNWERIKTALSGYDYVLTTEKDYAKLQFIPHNLPLVIVQTKLRMSQELSFPVKKT